ncbi:MAG: cytochrome b6-f complex subunit PetL [Gomphosphaeria aponina SAG 52.96 = DSM 107014]|uniref:Cytochrome b6-f complex subunit 6 n=1 Tax=Gomphosphaeria aponina SAG 52.96 = DSM 107014 TaxID=1521640 RepID=A0A941GVL6_9CHRO|nr:cytochrome b6-f complex subunit PetL [Gomphosphaeria aponina SAG 52.96 = DSM 107014]
MFAVISYIGVIVLYTAIALGLYFGFRAAKLI